MRKKGLFCHFAVLAIVIIGMSGCVKSGSSYSSTENITFLTIMNLASTSADIYVDGSKASSSSLASGYYDQAYEQLTPGTYQIQFKAEGTDSLVAELPSSLYDTTDFNTVILYNNAGSTSLNVVKIQDDYSTITTTAASFRFFNMSPDVPSVDLYFNNSKSQSNRTTADNVTYTAYNSFQSLTSGTYEIEAKVAGTDSVVASVTDVTMTAQTASTIFLTGNSGNSSNPIALKVLVASY